MNERIKIGTCGFRTNKAEYAGMLSAVEVQQTFYQPPQIKTLERWRTEVAPEFEFTLKAWQLITHEAKSPTFKRLKKTLTDAEKNEAGYFKPSEIVREARDATLAKCYYRLHGRTGFRYQYEKDELAELAELLPEKQISYVFFNNRSMLEDALLFQTIIGNC